MFDAKIDVAEIMEQIKQEAIQRAELEDPSFAAFPQSDRTFRETLWQISQLTKTIRETGEELHNTRNVGGVVPLYERFPVPVRQVFRFFSKVMRKGIQFVIQDQVDVNSRVDTILSAVEEREDLILQLILQLERQVRRPEAPAAPAPDSVKPEEKA